MASVQTRGCAAHQAVRGTYRHRGVELRGTTRRGRGTARPERGGQDDDDPTAHHGTRPDERGVLGGWRAMHPAERDSAAGRCAAREHRLSRTPDREGVPALSRAAVRPVPPGRRAGRRAAVGGGGPGRAGLVADLDVQPGHAAAAGYRPGSGQRSRCRVSRRTDARTRPRRATPGAGDRPGHRGAHRSHRHPQYPYPSGGRGGLHQRADPPQGKGRHLRQRRRRHARCRRPAVRAGAGAGRVGRPGPRSARGRRRPDDRARRRTSGHPPDLPRRRDGRLDRVARTRG